MATAQQVSFCVFWDKHFWCQVWKTLLLYFQRYSLFSILQFSLHTLWRHNFPNLHNSKTSISLKRKKIFQKGKYHYYFFGKACEISCNYFSCHRHFNNNNYWFIVRFLQYQVIKSASVKRHQNTHTSVKYEIKWKYQITQIGSTN